MFDIIIAKQNSHAVALQRLEDLLLNEISQKLERIMGAIVDLNAAIATLATTVKSATDAIAAELAKIAAAAPDDSAAVAAATANIKTLNDSLAAAVASTAAAPAPAPAPAPATSVTS